MRPGTTFTHAGERPRRGLSSRSTRLRRYLDAHPQGATALRAAIRTCSAMLAARSRPSSGVHLTRLLAARARGAGRLSETRLLEPGEERFLHWETAMRSQRPLQLMRPSHAAPTLALSKPAVVDKAFKTTRQREQVGRVLGGFRSASLCSDKLVPGRLLRRYIESSIATTRCWGPHPLGRRYAREISVPRLHRLRTTTSCSGRTLPCCSTVADDSTLQAARRSRRAVSRATRSAPGRR